MGYNNNSTPNQNVLQTTAGKLLSISSVNVTFFNKSIPYHRPIEKRKEPFISKLLLISTISGSPYYHNSWKTKSVL